jgi:hypothetical protein
MPASGTDCYLFMHRLFSILPVIALGVVDYARFQDRERNAAELLSFVETVIGSETVTPPKTRHINRLTLVAIT